MAKSSINKKAQALLALAEQLAQQPGVTWVDANNAVYSPGGPFSRLFPNRADRVAFSKTKESEQIDALIDSLPELPVRPMPADFDPAFLVPVGRSSKRRARVSAATRRR